MSKKTIELTFFAEDIKQTLSDRLHRVEGQVRGIGKMIQENRPCPKVLHQLNAAASALHGVTEIVLRNYLDNCVTTAIQGGDRQRKEATIDELMDVLKRFGQ